MITIILPAAGNGSRFTQAGYDKPKPLIDVFGVPMIKRVIDNLSPSDPHRVIVVSRLHHDELAPLLSSDDISIHLPYTTGGAVDTILKAKHYITADPVVVGNCDQLVHFDVDDFISSARGSDGALVTFRSNAEHHSYVNVDHTGAITKIVEKEVISHQAVTGVYVFNRGLDLVKYATQVIAHNDKFKQEFYLSSAIARMIADGKRITTYDAPSFMLGTPSELQQFEVAIQYGKEVL